ncbi:nuclear transport factor 2 family protein [Glaciecola siphonariae]|uniref:Nuclear transport factor 2 family protein n=1 Tax=Glaciecola siphonariae TaxID=521012 RepID=A0ABV9LX83_9ALTE
MAFQEWADGTGDPFSLLSNDMAWTIIGSTRTAGTYNLDEFKALVEPFNQIIAQPLRPTKWKTFADADTVVIHFTAQTPLKTGELYTNEYAWFFKFRQSKVVNVRAFLDLPKFERALDGEKL